MHGQGHGAVLEIFHFDLYSLFSKVSTFTYDVTVRSAVENLCLAERATRSI
jgi:hypothetical protein